MSKTGAGGLESRNSRLPQQLKGSAPMANNTNTPRALIRDKAMLIVGKAERAGVARIGSDRLREDGDVLLPAYKRQLTPGIDRSSS